MAVEVEPIQRLKDVNGDSAVGDESSSTQTSYLAMKKASIDFSSQIRPMKDGWPRLFWPKQHYGTLLQYEKKSFAGSDFNELTMHAITYHCQKGMVNGVGYVLVPPSGQVLWLNSRSQHSTLSIMSQEPLSQRKV